MKETSITNRTTPIVCKRVAAIILLSLFLTGLSSLAFADDLKAPFGFKWGQTAQQLEQIDSDSRCSDIYEYSFVICQTKSAPKPYSSGNLYTFTVYHNEGMQSITASSVDFNVENGKEEYSRLKRVLTKKYGSPSSNRENPGKRWESEITTWEANGGRVVLKLVIDKDDADSDIDITYDSPKYLSMKAANKAAQKAKKAADEDAL